MGRREAKGRRSRTAFSGPRSRQDSTITEGRHRPVPSRIKPLGGHPQNDEMDAGSLPPFRRPWSSSPNILASPAFGRNDALPSLESGFKHSGDRVHGLKSSEVDGSACSATSVLKVMDLKTALGLERGSVG
mgnify:CR=1 FL=1